MQRKYWIQLGNFIIGKNFLFVDFKLQRITQKLRKAQDLRRSGFKNFGKLCNNNNNILFETMLSLDYQIHWNLMNLPENTMQDY